MKQTKPTKIIVAMDADNRYPKIVQILDEDDDTEAELNGWLAGNFVAVLAETTLEVEMLGAVTNVENFTLYPNANITDPMLYLKTYNPYLFQQ